eukprot:s2020_g3.t1
MDDEMYWVLRTTRGSVALCKKGSCCHCLHASLLFFPPPSRQLDEALREKQEELESLKLAAEQRVEEILQKAKERLEEAVEEHEKERQARIGDVKVATCTNRFLCFMALFAPAPQHVKVSVPAACVAVWPRVDARPICKESRVRLPVALGLVVLGITARRQPQQRRRASCVVSVTPADVPSSLALSIGPALPSDQPALVVGALALAIVCHEAGHFLCMRSIGLPAAEFALGFGPEVVNFGRGPDGTEFVLRAFPFGGYVRFEDAKTVKLKDGRMVTEFDARSTAERIWVLAGGVLANVAVAWSSLVAGALVAGVPTKDFLPGIRISAVDDEAFARTGLKAADVLLRIGGLDLNFSGAEVRQTVAFINQLPVGRPVEMLVQRGTEEVLLTANTITDPNTGLQRLGVMIETNSQRVLAKAESFAEAWPRRFLEVSPGQLGTVTDSRVMWRCAKEAAGLFTGMGPGEMVGPVGIVKQGEDLMAAEGLLGIFIFFVTVNLNLAFINALPLPALDGGKALFVLAEQVSGQRLDENKKQDVEPPSMKEYQK